MYIRLQILFACFALHGVVAQYDRHPYNSQTDYGYNQRDTSNSPMNKYDQEKLGGRRTGIVATEDNIRAITYFLDGDLSSEERQNLDWAISELSKDTCIRFLHLTKKIIPIIDILVKSEYDSCHTYVSDSNTTSYNMYFSNYCLAEKETAMRTIKYTVAYLGKLRESQRKNQDDYSDSSEDSNYNRRYKPQYSGTGYHSDLEVSITPVYNRRTQSNQEGGLSSSEKAVLNQLFQCPSNSAPRQNSYRTENSYSGNEPDYSNYRSGSSNNFRNSRPQYENGPGNNRMRTGVRDYGSSIDYSARGSSNYGENTRDPDSSNYGENNARRSSNYGGNNGRGSSNYGENNRRGSSNYGENTRNPGSSNYGENNGRGSYNYGENTRDSDSSNYRYNNPDSNRGRLYY